MGILGVKEKENSANKPQLEQAQKDKQEYKLIDTYLRTKGLKLYSYNHSTTKIEEVVATVKKTIELDDKLESKNKVLETAQINSNHTYFEALNFKNAFRRVNKFKKLGKMDELCNLKKPGKIEVPY